jgi:hypothetical protein
VELQGNLAATFSLRLHMLARPPLSSGYGDHEDVAELLDPDAAFEAFEAERPGVLASLREDQLRQVVLYHVADGWVGAADLEDGASVPTLLEGASS